MEEFSPDSSQKSPAIRLTLLFAYLLVLSSIALLYLATYYYAWLYNSIRVPRGDPFSYTTGWFMLLDNAHSHYWNTLFQVVSSNGWYWLQEFLIALISPVLIKAPFSLELINYFMMFFATLSLFRLARRLVDSIPLALVLSVVLWFFPSLYAIDEPGGLLNLQLDTSFNFALIISVCEAIIFSIELTPRNGVLAGLACGFAVWGRGNSLPYVIFILIVPIAVISYKVTISLTQDGTQRPRSLLSRNLHLMAISTFLVISVAMAAWYYVHTLGNISGYYTVHAKIIFSQKRFSIPNIFKLIENFPGSFFFRGAIQPIYFTVMAHMVVLFSLIVSFTTKSLPEDRKMILRTVSLSGCAVFYGTLIMLASLFSDSAFTGGDIAYLPMLIGLLLSILAVVASLAGRPTPSAINEPVLEVGHGLMIAACGVAILYGHLMTEAHTRLSPVQGADSPREVADFSMNLGTSGQQGSIAWLWYELYSPAIVNYYRVEYDFPLIHQASQPMRLYDNEYWNSLWNAAKRDDLDGIRAGLERTFHEADYIIIPASFNYYWGNEPYPLYIHKDMVRKIAMSDQEDRFTIMRILHDQSADLFFLKRVTTVLSSGKVKRKGEDGFTLSQLYGMYAENRDIVAQLAAPWVGGHPPDGQQERRVDQISSSGTPVRGAVVYASRVTGPSGIQMAFDGSTSVSSYWEVLGPFPISATIVKSSPMRLDSYTLEAGETWDRMPSTWVVRGSMNGKNWKVLSRVENQISWKLNEKRTFRVSGINKSRYLRIDFMAGVNPNILRIYEISLDWK